MAEEIDVEELEKIKFAVDVPPSYPDRNGSYQEWVNVNYFETREEAIKFAQDNFGADENGMVSLISAF